MQTRKRYEKASVTLNGDISSMLKRAKTVLSCDISLFTGKEK